MSRATINELRKEIYDLAEEMKAEASYDDDLWEVMGYARQIMSACDDIEAYLEPDDYEETLRDVGLWHDAQQRVS